MPSTKITQKNFRNTSKNASTPYDDYDDPVRVCIECGAPLDPGNEGELCEDCQNIKSLQNQLESSWNFSAFLKKQIDEIDNQLDFLQCAFLIVLLNPNLYEQLQDTLCQEINLAGEDDQGVDILNRLLESDNRENLLGPDDVDKEMLDTVKLSLYNKLTNYRQTRKFNI